MQAQRPGSAADRDGCHSNGCGVGLTSNSSSVVEMRPAATNTGMSRVWANTGMSCGTNTGMSYGTNTGISRMINTGMSRETNTGMSCGTSTGISRMINTGVSCGTCSAIVAL